jgi:phage baseplate assembly protein W
MASKNYFIDLDLNFQPNYIDRDVTIKINEDAVKRSLRNLILLRRFEKPFHPEVSSGIQDLLFENPSPVVYSVLQGQIEELIRKYEPRVNNLAVGFYAEPDKNSVTLNIKFTIANRPQVLETNILLERTR